MESGSAYGLFSLAMRYVFTGLLFFIAVYAFLAVLREARAWNNELRSLPDAGKIGELYDRAREKSVPLPREGVIGKGRSCDARIGGKGVGRDHAMLCFIPGKGLKVTTCFARYVTVNGKRVKGSAVLVNGDLLAIGDREYQVRFFSGLDAPFRAKTEYDKTDPQEALWGEANALDGSFPDEWGSGWGADAYSGPLCGGRQNGAGASQEGRSENIQDGWGEQE